MGWILSWQEFLKIDAVREETANGFRIHGPRAGKTTSGKGKKAAAAAATSAFHQWWGWGCLRVWGKWGLEGFSQLSSSLLWSWRALWCYAEGDTCHISVACISLKMIKLQDKCVGRWLWILAGLWKPQNTSCIWGISGYTHIFFPYLGSLQLKFKHLKYWQSERGSIWLWPHPACLLSKFP